MLNLFYSQPASSKMRTAAPHWKCIERSIAVVGCGKEKSMHVLSKILVAPAESRMDSPAGHRELRCRMVIPYDDSSIDLWFLARADLTSASDIFRMAVERSGRSKSNGYQHGLCYESGGRCAP